MGLAVIFPGQGTQAPGIGSAWTSHPAWELVERAEEITGEPLRRLLVDATADELARTREAQLAVFLASALAWEAVKDRLGTPVAFAGHSLGQISALVAAGGLTFDAGISLVVARATLTQEAADRRPGRLAALLGADLGDARAACEAAGGCWIANDNAPGQVVVGGTPEGTDAAVEHARAIGVRRAVVLDVGGAFHTPLMEPARRAFARVLEGVEFTTLSAPVVANTDAAAHEDRAWHDRLAEHLVQPVRWRECVLTLAALGVEHFVEVGPGSTLGGLVRRTVDGATTDAVAEPSDLETLAA